MPGEYSVYVLWSPTGRRFYVGVTGDVVKRLDEHNAGVSKWTSRYAGTWVVVCKKAFPGLGAARRYENLLKRQKGGQGFFLHTGLDPEDYR